jgi:hypothetical protein
MKIRYYGFMSPGSSVSLGRVRSLIELAFGFDVQIPMPEPKPVRVPTCPDCGAKMKLRCHIFVSHMPGFGYG